jgi:transketolase N-terminal domain/subunit
VYIDISREIKPDEKPLSSGELEHFEMFDLIYRSLCALLFNYAPASGHPGGSISSGRIVFGLVFDAMDYDVSNPDRQDADIISYAAGHKALGLYTMWALRNEVMRIGAPELLPLDKRYQLRLEDLLGFRRNPITKTPFFTRFDAKPLDGHPTPATPFLRLATGASGVGVATSVGLAFGAMDYYGNQAPRVHIVEGEGGMTPGRVSETMAAAGTASLKNTILHIDLIKLLSIQTMFAATFMDLVITCNGIRWSLPIFMTGMSFWYRKETITSKYSAHSVKPPTSAITSQRLSSITQRRVGNTASKEKRPTVPGTNSVPTGFMRLSNRLSTSPALKFRSVKPMTHAAKAARRRGFLRSVSGKP